MAEIKKEEQVIEPPKAVTDPLKDQPISAPVAQPQQPAAPGVDRTALAGQVDLAFEGLTPKQKQEIKSVDSFRARVDMEKQKGINEDLAIGNIIMGLNKTVPPTTVVKTDDADKLVNDTKADLDKDKEKKDAFIGDDAPISDIVSEDPEISSINSAIDSEFQQQFDLLEQRKATLEGRAAEQVSSIQSIFDARRKEMQTFNANRLKSLEIIGGRSGRQRFAQEWQSGLLSAEEKAGMDRVSVIAAEEFEAISGVRAALEDNDFQLMQTQLELASQKRKEKEDAIEKLHQQAIATEEFNLKLRAADREDQKFLIDNAKFQLEMDKSNFDQASKIAEQAGQRLDIDEAGNIVMLPELTFANSLKLDNMNLEIERFGLDKTMKQAQLELSRNGFELNIAKFNQDVAEFDINTAIKNSNLRLQEQKLAIDRQKAGFPTSYDDVGIIAPNSEIAAEVGNVITGADASVVGANGYIRPAAGETGWECAEYAEQLVDLGTPNNVMGDSLADKIATIEKYGITKDEIVKHGGFAVGDVIVTDASDVSSDGNALQWGHVAVISGIAPDGMLILQEANRRNDGEITSGRTISPQSDSIQGILGRPNERSVGEVGLKGKFRLDAVNRAGENLAESFKNDLEAEMDKVIPDKDVVELAKVDPRVKFGMTRRELAGLNIDLAKTEQNLETANEIFVLADSLLKDPALSASVGLFSQFLPSPATFTGATSDFTADFKRLTSLLTLDNLSLMTGVLTDKDIEILKDAATSLSKGTTEGKFKEELNKIISSVQQKVDIRTADRLLEKYDGANEENKVESLEYTSSW